MQTAWLKGLKGQDKEKRKAEVLGYRNAFDSLKEILERDYEAPNWELRQIAVNEYNQSLDDLIKLITLEHKE